MEKRQFSRVPFNTTVNLYYSDNKFIATGEIKNISMSGVLVTCSENISIDTIALVEITLENGDNPVKIQISGIVVRIINNLVAIKLDLHKLSLDSLTHLKNIVSYNLGDADTVMEEIFKNSEISI